MRRFAWWCIAIVWLVVAIGITYKRNHLTGVVHIGRILPLTGEYDYFGKSEKQGTDLAVDEVNSTGGIEGVRLEVIYKDNAGDKEKTKRVAQELVEKRVPIIIGATLSSNTLEVANIGNRNNTVVLAPLSSAPKVTQGPYVFRVMPPDNAQARALAYWMYSEGHSKLAIISADNAWSNGLLELTRIAFRRLGGTVTYSGILNENQDNQKELVKEAVKSGAEILYLPLYKKEAASILKETHSLGVAMPIFGSEWYGEDFIHLCGVTAEGVKFTNPAKFRGNTYKIFERKFIERYKTNPDVAAAAAYDAVMIAATCMRRISSEQNILPQDIDGKFMRMEIRNLKGDNAYLGATGITSYDSISGDPSFKTFERKRILNGEIVSVE